MLCSACGVGTILEDTQGVETTMVCDECGCISSASASISLVNNQTILGTSSSQTNLECKYHVSFDNKESRQRQRFKKYFDKIDKCISTFSQDPSAMIKAASDMFFEVLVNHYLYKQAKVKILLAGVCVYIALCESRIPVPIRTVCRYMDTPAVGFSKCLIKVKELTSCIVPRLDKESAEVAIKSLPCMKDRLDLSNKAMEFVSLMEKMSITHGRRVTAISHIAAYFAVVSEEKKSNRCTSIKRFCKSNNLGPEIFPTASLVKSKIIILAKRLPWMLPESSKRTVFHLFLDDVLRYKEFLFMPMNEDEKIKLRESLSGEKIDVSADTDGLIGSCAVSPPPPLEGDHLPVKDKLPSSSCTLTEFATLRLPPTCVRKRKNKPITVVGTPMPVASTSEILTEEDLPDAEMKYYLRNPDELLQVKEIRRLLESADEGDIV